MKYEAGAVLYNGKKNIIWGAGQKGFQTLLALCELDIYIDLVCDSNKEIQGLRFFNKKVVSPEEVLAGSGDCNIVIAVEKEKYVQEIENSLRQAGMVHYVHWRDIYGKDVLPGYQREYLYWMIRDSYSKKLVIYGADEEGEKLRHTLCMLDVNVEFYIEDAEYEYEWNGMVVKPVYDLFYEEREEYKVLVTAAKSRQAEQLKKMGLRERIDYNMYYEYMPNRHTAELYMLDPFLGYNFVDRSSPGHAGFTELGEQEAFTIVLLGGSATDGIAYPFQSWGDILYERFRENGYHVRILNGGCAGYKSSQELVKLMRDVLPLKPDVVVHYTGFNDANNCDKEYVFVHPYQKEILDYAAGLDGEGGKESGHYNRKAYTLGVADHRPAWEIFATHVRTMQAVCSQQGILYVPFLQPSLAIKGKRSVWDQELILNTLSQNYITFLTDLLENFYGNLRMLENGIWEDLTSLLDDCDDVYLDICHVTESGNDKIAQYMFEYLTGKGIVKK